MLKSTLALELRLGAWARTTKQMDLGRSGLESPAARQWLPRLDGAPRCRPRRRPEPHRAPTRGQPRLRQHRRRNTATRGSPRRTHPARRIPLGDELGPDRHQHVGRGFAVRRDVPAPGEHVAHGDQGGIGEAARDPADG